MNSSGIIDMTIKANVLKCGIAPAKMNLLINKESVTAATTANNTEVKKCPINCLVAMVPS